MIKNVWIIVKIDLIVDFVYITCYNEYIVINCITSNKEVIF